MGQVRIGPDLLLKSQQLRDFSMDGGPILVVCGLYQLFGRGFITVEGLEIPGIDIFAASTTGSTTRMIGNIIVDSPFGRLVGFENHSGQTLLEPGQTFLGNVVKGFGNNSDGNGEGAIMNASIGTYMHGPILPKNPALADHLILSALSRKFGIQSLSALDDQLAMRASGAAATRPQ